MFQLCLLVAAPVSLCRVRLLCSTHAAQLLCQAPSTRTRTSATAYYPTLEQVKRRYNGQQTNGRCCCSPAFPALPHHVQLALPGTPSLNTAATATDNHPPVKVKRRYDGCHNTTSRCCTRAPPHHVRHVLVEEGSFIVVQHSILQVSCIRKLTDDPRLQHVLRA